MSPKQSAKLADTLKKAIADSGLSLPELARQCGVAQPVLYRFVQGTRDPALATVERLADYFGLRLVGKENDQTQRREKAMTTTMDKPHSKGRRARQRRGFYLPAWRWAARWLRS